MCNLTGLKKNPFPIHQDPDDNPTGETSNDAATTVEKMPLEFSEEIDSEVNAALIKRAALLVYREQTVRTFTY